MNAIADKISKIVDGKRVIVKKPELLAPALWLTPERALRGAVVLALVMGAWSLGAGMSPPRARITGRVRLPVVALVGLIIVTAATFRLLLVRAATEPRVLRRRARLHRTSHRAVGARRPHWRFLRGEPEPARSLLVSAAHQPASTLLAGRRCPGVRGRRRRSTPTLVALSAAPRLSCSPAGSPAPGLAARSSPCLVAFAAVDGVRAPSPLTEPLFLYRRSRRSSSLLARMLERCSTRLGQAGRPRGASGVDRQSGPRPTCSSPRSSARSGSAAFGHRPSRGRFGPIGSCSSRSGRGSCWRYSLSGRGRPCRAEGPATSPRRSWIPWRC